MKDNEQTQRRATWRKIVGEYLVSDMTQKAFCEKHTISYRSSFIITVNSSVKTRHRP